MQKANTPSPALTSWTDRWSRALFIWPAAAILLFFSIFPLLVSLYLSFSRLKFVKGGVQVLPVGLLNYRKLLVGSEQNRFLGVFAMPSVLGWLIMLVIGAGLLYFLVDYLRSGQAQVSGFILRLVLVAILLALVGLVVSTMTSTGRPGTLPVTLFYVFAGLLLQYLLGLGLALLAAQQLSARRFFRVVFLLPMMITPVGVAFMIRMMADTSKGPFSPLLQAAGLGDWSWVNSAWGSRLVILMGDVWQWTPFMFIVLLAAVEGQAHEPVEAAVVDAHPHPHDRSL
jgi:multiple sugar transport system permease protein